MRLPIAVCLVATLAVTSCGTIRDSRVNPFNWFGGARSQPVSTNASAATGAGNPLLPQRRAGLSVFQKSTRDYAGRPVAQISELVVERRPGGAIIRASAVADRVGPFDVRMIRDEAAPEGTLSYTFSALQRPGPRNAGPDARTVTAAVRMTDNELAGIRRIEVRGRDNVLVSNR